MPGAVGLPCRGGRRSGRAGQPHAQRAGRGRQDPERRHAGPAPGAVRRECRHGGALPAADAVPGPRQLSRERHRAHAPAAAGGAGRGPAPARLSHRHAQRSPARRHPRHRAAPWGGLQRQRRGELAVRVSPAALGRHRRLADHRHRRQRGRAALRRHDAPAGEGLPLERRHLRHRGRCLGCQLLLGRRLAAARRRQPRHGRADAQRAACRPTRSSWT